MSASAPSRDSDSASEAVNRVQAPIAKPSATAVDYLSWYARKDLDAPKAQLVTRLVVLALGMMSGLLMTAAAIALWIPTVQTSRLERSPLAKSLWIGQPENQDKLLTEGRIKEIRETIQTFATPESIRVFKRFAMKFQASGTPRPAPGDRPGQPLQPSAGEPGPRRPQEWMGRTVESDDLILSRLGAADNAEGIVVTRELLDLLGFGPRESPAQLAVRFRDEHRWQDVPVLFVADIRLPYNLKFLIPRKEYNKLYLTGHEATWTGADVGPIPLEWPKGAELSRDEAFGRAMDDWGVEVRIDRRAGHLRYQFTSQNKLPKVEGLWLRILEEFRTELIRYREERQQDAAPAKAMTLLKSHDVVEPVLPTVVFDLAEVRVRNLNDLKATALGCRHALYPADETLVSQVDQVHQVGRLLLLALFAICAILLIIICLIMVISQKLRCELKVPEIGMLKAMGISRAEFLRMFYHQAMILWGRSLILGAAFTVVGSTLIAVLSGSDLSEMSLLLAHSAGAILVIAVITAFVIALSLRVATRASRSSDPMESLRYG